jgi:hypothetical protein
MTRKEKQATEAAKAKGCAWGMETLRYEQGYLQGWEAAREACAKAVESAAKPGDQHDLCLILGDAIRHKGDEDA